MNKYEYKCYLESGEFFLKSKKKLKKSSNIARSFTTIDGESYIYNASEMMSFLK